MKTKIIILLCVFYSTGINAQKTTCFAKKRMCDRRLYVDAYDKLAFDEETQTYFLKSDYRTRFDGTCETCYRNNVLTERITIKNGKREGSDTSFFKSGCLLVSKSGANIGYFLHG